MSATFLDSTIGIALGRPATIDAAGYAAMVPIATTGEGIVSISSVGDSHGEIAVETLGSRTQTLKGQVRGDNVSISFSRKLVATTGQLSAVQAAFKAASDSKHNEYTIIHTEASGIKHYFTGPVMNWKPNEATVSSYAGFTVDVANNTGEITFYPAP